MLQKNLKFTHERFEYFLLQIKPDTKLDEIQSKLEGFKKLEQNGYIVLSVDGDMSSDLLGKTVLGITDIADSLKLKFHAVLRSEYIREDNILGTRVIDIPKAIKSNHIYNKSLIVAEPLRSGMTIENDGDIIVTSFVSDNAEVVASGNIHVYGEAKGRLIAGSGGDKSARIFVSKFNPELIAIGGLYRTMDEKLPDNILHKSVMVTLDSKNRLIIEPVAK